MRRTAPWLLLGAALLAGCGEAPQATPTDLAVTPLEDTPVGDEIRPPRAPSPGLWIADVLKTWTVVQDGGAPQTGHARLEVRLAVEDGGGTREARLGIRVVGTEGVAGRYVSAYDGLELTFSYAPDGRPDPNTIRYVSEAPADAGSFLKGLWLGGLALGTPWIPPTPLRVGLGWRRQALGDGAAIAPPPGGTVRIEGGGRLAAAEGDGDELRLRVELDTLVETEARHAVEAVRLGVHDRGTATLRAEDGVPLAWSLAEEARVRRATQGGEGTLDVRLEVEGRLRSATGDPEAAVGRPGSDR